MIVQLMVNALASTAGTAISAVAFALVYRSTGVFHIGQAAIYVWAVYLLYLSYVLLGMSLIPALIVALLAIGLLGISTEALVFAPLAGSRSSSLVRFVSSLALYVVLVSVLSLLFGNETRLLRSGPQETFRIGAIIVTSMQAVQAGTAVVLLVAVGLLLARTRWGKMVRAMSSDYTLAVTVGIHVQRVRREVFALAGVLVAIAGILTAFDVGMGPYGGLPAFFTAFVAAIVGGKRPVLGPVFGALLLGLIQAMTLWFSSARWVDLATFATLTLFLVLRFCKSMDLVYQHEGS